MIVKITITILIIVGVLLLSTAIFGKEIESRECKDCDMNAYCMMCSHAWYNRNPIDTLKEMFYYIKEYFKNKWKNLK